MEPLKPARISWVRLMAGPVGRDPHKRGGAEASLVDFAALHMSACGTKRR
jgi:hypothetical protein